MDSTEMDRDALIRRIAELQERLRKEEYENAMLRRVLFMQHEKQPRPMRRLNLPISERAVVLFEVLPTEFSVDDVFEAAERLHIAEIEASEHIRTYLDEQMTREHDDGKRFAKTGHRPYFTDLHTDGSHGAH